MISVLIVDDHEIVRAGIKMMIDEQPDMKVIGEAGDGQEAVQKAQDLMPDVVIMDLNLPKKSGIVAIREITEENDEIKIIALTMHDGREYIFGALQAGASSYLLKSHRVNDLLEAVRTVSKGEAYLYPNATKFLLEDYIWKSAGVRAHTLMNLSGREQEVLSYLAKGYTNREVAERLFVSIKTIESHRSKIMEKLNLKTRPALVEYAAKNGFLDFS
ncbi:response regulator [Sporosarcina koreensis]|uniref:response regulator n=1 Tax=Sporosarcina koreensis TaxID=334735 RepID=UPI00075C6681|nr:response regulator transcription factor [Sporosarcina koreensis]